MPANPKPTPPEETATEKILEADFNNLIKKVAAGKPLTTSERDLIRSRKAAKTASANVPGTDVIGAPEPTSYDSIGAAAAGMGVAVAVLRKAKRKGAPGFRGSRVYPGELWPWLKGQTLKQPPKLSVEPSEPLASLFDDKEALEIRCLAADAEKKEFATARLKGEFSRNADIAAALRAIANEQQTILRQKLENEYPSVVTGLEVAQARVYGKKVVDALYRLIADLAEKFESGIPATNEGTQQ